MRKGFFPVWVVDFLWIVIAILCFSGCEFVPPVELPHDNPVDPDYEDPTPTYYTVTFESNGGTDVDAEVVEEGEAVAEPDPPPTKTGFLFVGWCADSELTTPWDFENDTVSSDITLYAKWSVVTYTVTFESNGGNSIDPRTVPDGGTVEEPDPEPARSGCTFGGWFADTGFTTEWDFATDTVTGDMTLYARWLVTLAYAEGEGNTGGSIPLEATEYDHGTEVTVAGNTGNLVGGVIQDGIKQRFKTWNTQPDGLGADYAPGDVLTIAEHATLYALYTTGTGVLRKTGPGGGLVFYDKGVYSEGWRYLEAAPAGWSGTAKDPVEVWSNHSTTAVPGTYTGTGYGQGNSINIMKQSGHTASAASLCDDYVVGAYDDWFLPSKNELDLMYTNLKEQGSGGFQNENYWSSTEEDYNSAKDQDFEFGGQGFLFKANSNYVRAARRFNDSAIYLLREPGPANGVIFHSLSNGDGTYTYYEAAASDQSAGQVWSNVGSSEVMLGVNAGIGWGGHNTLFIDAQSSTSAAHVCRVYTGGDRNDWFLPSMDELDKIWVNLVRGTDDDESNPTYTSVGNFNSVDFYWSSTEYDASNARNQNLGSGIQEWNGKANQFRTRPVRAF